MKGRVGEGSASSVMRDLLAGNEPQKIAEAPKHKSVWIRADIHAELVRRAGASGVALGEYVANALLERKTPLPAMAHVVAPLGQVSYRLIQIAEALDRGDVIAAKSDVETARRIIAQALLPLRRQHAQEVHELHRHGEEWSG